MLESCRIFKYFFAIIIALFSLLNICNIQINAWQLAQIGLNESYRVRHLTTHFSRVFLCITVESKSFPTLIEAQWPETYLPMRAAVYPTYLMHDNGKHRDCARIQQARWSQVDSLSRLWTLDMGWKSADVTCYPKLLVFDLIKNNMEVLRIDCSKYIEPEENKLLEVKLGPQPSPCEIERMIFFILADKAHLIAYDIVQQNWHRYELQSQKYTDVSEIFPIVPVDIAFGQQKEILISDDDGSLYQSIIKVDELNDTNNVVSRSNDTMKIIQMKRLGNLLGRSKGMMVDQVGALFYMVSKFGAVVRCEYKSNMTAEDNEIIYMTSKNVQQIFFGTEGSVWLLADRLLKPQDRCFSGL